MENTIYSDELQHHGTKGMRWGIRRYQNKDGSLTPAGQKRYNKEVEKLKKEEAKVKAAETAAANRQKTQSKFDKLDAKKQALDERKKALKEGSSGKKDDDQPTETLEERRARLLKSTDAKELYKNKDDLTTFELQERLNRIDLEARLNSKIPAEPHQKTGMEYMESATNTINKATNLYKSVDNAFTTVANSTMGKTLAKSLGIELPKKKVDYKKMLENLDDLDSQQMMDLNKREVAKNSLEKIKSDRKKAKEEAEAKAAQEKKAKDDAAKAQKEYDDFQERYKKGEVDNQGNTIDKGEPYRKKADDLSDNVTYTRDRQLPAVVSNTNLSSVPSTIVNSGRSTCESSLSKAGATRISDVDVEVTQPDWYTKMKNNGMI